MTAIFKREFRSFFQGMIGYLVIAFLLAFVGIYFSYYNLLAGYPEVAITLNYAAFIFYLVIPILTMKIFSEERKQKIDQLLLTAPISVIRIVLGKYLAMLSVLAIPIGIICVYPLILKMFGTVAMAGSYVAILGYLLYGATGIAIGLFVSSITESQVISAVVTFGILLLSNLMGGIQSMLSVKASGILQTIMNSLNLQEQMSNLLNSIVDIKAIIYYLSAIFLFLFLTVQSIQKRRWS